MNLSYLSLFNLFSFPASCLSLVGLDLAKYIYLISSSLHQETCREIQKLLLLRRDLLTNRYQSLNLPNSLADDLLTCLETFIKIFPLAVIVESTFH